MDLQMRHLVDNLELSVRSLQDLLDGLLDLSRLDAGSIHVRLGPVNVGALLDSMQSALEPIAQAKGLRLRIRSTALWVESDAVQLQRMVMNLALNALRYTDDGTVLIACRPDSGGQGVRIEVWDSGIGIAPQYQQDIFKEFYQVEVGSALRERAFGLGLGLNIVERTAELLGCRVSLRSVVGCGTRFAISVPRRIPALVEPNLLGASVATPVDDLVGLRVLVIEDDSAARLAVCELLMSWSCEVLAAGNAEEARTVVRRGAQLDLIVSDFQLGAGDDGLAAIVSLRALTGRDVPACLMSGKTDATLQFEAKAAGLSLLHKPVRPAKLRSLLRRLVASGETGHATDS
jgi:CheY-like chemotaxis protein/anti-sigma regulatory factor (Ser/Thr protein kinase)